MSNKDRETFEAFMTSDEAIINDYSHYAVWQGARDRYAPKLTYEEAMKLIDDIIWRQRPTMATEILAALKAGGLRFKEEA